LDCAVNVPDELKHKFKGRKCQPSKLNSVDEEDGGELNSILKGKQEKRSRIEDKESQTHQTKKIKEGKSLCIKSKLLLGMPRNLENLSDDFRVKLQFDRREKLLNTEDKENIPAKVGIAKRSIIASQENDVSNQQESLKLDKKSLSLKSNVEADVKTLIPSKSSAFKGLNGIFSTKLLRMRAILKDFETSNSMDNESIRFLEDWYNFCSQNPPEFLSIQTKNGLKEVEERILGLVRDKIFDCDFNCYFI